MTILQLLTTQKVQPPPAPPIYGCTDPLATNYNPSATVDDGSCTYSTYSTEAQAYFDAVAAVPGSVPITDIQKQRYNDWVVYQKSIGKYSLHLAIFPCYGGIEAAHKINAKTLGLGTFHGTWIHNTSGCKPNGVDAWFDTGINPKTAMGASTVFQMGFYSRSDIQADGFDLGAATTGHQAMLLTAISGAIGRIGSDSIQAIEGSFSHSLGYRVVRRTSNTNLCIAANGSIIATNTSANGLDLPNTNIYAGAYSSSGTATGFSARQFCWIDILGGALDDSQLFNSNVYVEGIQDAFVRGVQ